jgi:hypothetical protein
MGQASGIGSRNAFSAAFFVGSTAGSVIELAKATPFHGEFFHSGE